jgi:outer membrane protein insertion porin family
MSARVGTERKDLSIALTEPFFMGKRLALTTEAFYRDLLFLSDFYDQTQYGGTVSFRKPVTEFGYASLGYTAQQFQIDPSRNASQAIQDEGGDFFDSLVSLDFTHDTRDSVFLAREGHKVTAGVEYSGLGGDVDSTTLSLAGQQHFGLPGDAIFSLLGRYNKVEGDAPIFKRQFLGGANNLRGFDYREVGPKDSTGEPLGGDESWFATAEMTYPLVEKIRIAGFYDIGEVSGGPGQFGGGINSNYGAGLRLFVLGNAPIRLDYGIPVDSDQFNDSGGRFNFTMGYQF